MPTALFGAVYVRCWVEIIVGVARAVKVLCCCFIVLHLIIVLWASIGMCTPDSPHFLSGDVLNPLRLPPPYPHWIPT